MRERPFAPDCFNTRCCLQERVSVGGLVLAGLCSLLAADIDGPEVVEDVFVGRKILVRKEPWLTNIGILGVILGCAGLFNLQTPLWLVVWPTFLLLQLSVSLPYPLPPFPPLLVTSL